MARRASDRGGSRVAVLLSLMWLAALPLMGEPATRTLSFEDRVGYQRRIEEVYWKHRIWPKENPGAKPALAAVLPEVRLRAQVEDFLKKSNALAALWKRPLTAAQLQAEMERMARQSQAPEVLREIFAALDDDPFVIGEMLARQTLADRLIRSWYAHDERFHGDLRRQAETALARVSSGADLSALGAEYGQMTWRLEGGDETNEEDQPGEIALDADAWQEQLDRLAGLLGTERNLRTDAELLSALPLMTVSALQDEDEAFFVTSVVKKGAESVTVATASWPKVAFDAWWATQAATASADLAPVGGPLTAVEVTASTTCEPGTWQPTSGAAPGYRTAHTAVWTGSEMIVWGGVASSLTQLYNTGGRYNPSTDSWVGTATTGAPIKRQSHTAVWTGSEMIVWGGYYCVGDEVVNCSELASGGRYDPSSDSWVATSTTGVPSPRSFHTAVWTGSEMIVWGGANLYDAFPVNTGARYDPSTNTWIATTISGAPPARSYPTAVWTGSEMIVWGGHSCVGWPCSVRDTGGRYDPSTDSWIATTTSGAPPARLHHTAVWTGSEMIVWGGYGGSSSYFDTGGRYDPSADTWVATTMVGVPTARSSHTAVWTGSEMIVWGGSGSSTYDLDTGGRYDPSTDTWGATTTSGAPTQRSEHTAVWTGSEMVVWGGANLYDPVNTGARYDPSTDTWIATTSGAPSKRQSHTAVWTGSEMIVWGGASDNLSTRTGARYNPSTQVWVPTTTSGAPTKRSGHTAVWTGSEMIVWGPPNTGGRYNPLTDSWVATTTTGAPAERWAHSAVWTGSEMIIWGGVYDYGPSSYFATGGRYDPSTNSWVATAIAGAPTARAYHTAVWTGSKMIVWGGLGGAWLNTGGRYDPEADTWGPTSTTGVPLGRYKHTAVWTGSEMIVWGGYGGSSSYFDTGGRYDPSADTWVATTMVGVPTARSSHTAVWTGSEMIVWGGYGGGGSSSYFDTGGRYDPSTDSWVATTPTAAPLARSGHTAVWTGCGMIIWGGASYTAGTLDTGGHYSVSSCESNDGDLVPDCYDNCPLAANGLQEDSDHDSVGDVCDSCTDTDGDGSGDPGFPANTCALDNCLGLPNESQADTDHDSVGDLCDNCYLAVNVAQEDTDTDGLGDACDSCTDTDGDGSGDPGFPANTCALDNCLGLPNESQADSDHDSLGDYCDNCYLAVNVAQKDADGDGAGDACDCVPDEAGIYIILGPAHDLHFLSKTELAWDKPLGDDNPSLTYDLLRAGGPSDWLAATCLETSITVTSASDTEIPAGVFFYLVRVQSECGDNLGSTSADVRRVGIACE